MSFPSQTKIKCFSDSTIAKGMTVARTKASGIVKNVIATNKLEYLVNELKNVKFSIFVDGVNRYKKYGFVFDIFQKKKHQFK